ncbi:hypothetical protein DDZ13_12075 [Coraliomargarita sinensis]|uniref:Glycosyltransferase RgtA/B/C/D-like domain-containing protein n=1 Tax=Coraliomargarita sinensis TaxID=2174842 RepID=A0A317ZDL8_9BACT|nr:hypothetical protein [Coraliomargarita sinensis]PXA03424.1 hypothetical protein DDZ13_12075 [Coraliomargarita sinensis]
MAKKSATPESPQRPQSDLIIPPTMVTRDSAKRKPVGENKAPKRIGIWAYAALIILTLLVYAPTLQTGLLWSEYDTVERTPYQSLEDWSEAWSAESIRRHDPITLSSYFIESHLPLPAATAHRLINLILHLLAALLLLKLLESLKLRGAYAAALVFALHPAALQTLFWPGYRHELVGLVFILASLFFGIRNRDLKDFILALALAIISSLLHSAALVLPLLLALCIFYQNKFVHLHHYNRVLPFFCVALFTGVWTHAGQAGAPASEELSALTKAGQNLYFYLRQSFLPVDRQLFHVFSERQSYNVGAANNLLAFLFFVPFYVLIAFNHRKRWARGLFLGLSSYILLLLYGIAQTGRFIDGSLAKEEYALYVALPAAIAITFCSLAGFFESKHTFGRILWSGFFGLFLLVQITLTASYSFAVSDKNRMWQSMAEQWDNSWLPKAALVESVRSSESDLLSQSEIIRTLEEILETNPDRHGERILLARTYREAGQNTNALREYKRILRDTDPDNAFLEEAADFFDSLNLSWEANNTRERITHSKSSAE